MGLYLSWLMIFTEIIQSCLLYLGELGLAIDMNEK